METSIMDLCPALALANLIFWEMLRRVSSKFYEIMQGHVTPLPDDREEYRRQCVLLCAELGMTLYTANEARLRHVCKVSGFVPGQAIALSQTSPVPCVGICGIRKA
jgi:hypothetical protein